MPASACSRALRAGTRLVPIFFAQTSLFVYATRRDRTAADLGALRITRVLLFCCKNSGKTSLLFQFAVNRAAESGRGVVFICSKGRMENNPPFLSQVRSLRFLGSVVYGECDQSAEFARAGSMLLISEVTPHSVILFQGVDPSMSLLQRIQIKYTEDGDEIRKYFAAFHLLENFPAAVIVDDFADFFSERSCQQRYETTRARDLAMVRILALCHNAIGHANAKLGSLGSCNLLLSDVLQGDTPRSLFIYKRWINSVYTIRADGTGSYILQNTVSPESETKKARKAKYSVALQYLVLEEISS
ncbi:unnamed protein product [Urochloa decumbens]|uniref:Uncharacterized protein n=1 Tax=Urochloa decumbens TaxID=240449 RepID=A0ABC8WY16_9POAL